MDDRLTLERAVEILREAFKPLHCGVEAFDFGQKVRFRVFDADEKALLNMAEMKASQAQNPHDLADAIKYARSRLKDQGFNLDSWQFPPA